MKEKTNAERSNENAEYPHVVPFTMCFVHHVQLKMPCQEKPDRHDHQAADANKMAQGISNLIQWIHILLPFYTLVRTEVPYPPEIWFSTSESLGNEGHFGLRIVSTYSTWLSWLGEQPSCGYREYQIVPRSMSLRSILADFDLVVAGDRKLNPITKHHCLDSNRVDVWRWPKNFNPNESPKLKACQDAHGELKIRRDKASHQRNQ